MIFPALTSNQKAKMEEMSSNDICEAKILGAFSEVLTITNKHSGSTFNTHWFEYLIMQISKNFSEHPALQNGFTWRDYHSLFLAGVDSENYVHPVDKAYEIYKTIKKKK